MHAPKHITEITKDWFASVTKGANLDVGPGLKKDDHGDGRKISIDETQFKLMVYAILKHTVSVTGFNYVDPNSYTLDFEH